MEDNWPVPAGWEVVSMPARLPTGFFAFVLAERDVPELPEVRRETARAWEQLWNLATTGDSGVSSAANIRNLFCIASLGSGMAGASAGPGPGSNDYLGAGRVGDGRETACQGELLPRDILERIQACLPVVNFFQSRLVSKNWHKSLTSPGTRDMHAQLAPKEQWLLTFPYTYGREGNDCLPPPYVYDLQTETADKKWRRLPVDCVCPKGVVGNFAVGGGLVCYEEGREHAELLRGYPIWKSRNIVICNPLNGSRKSLPVPTVAAEAELRVVGFVREDVSQEYKIYGVCVTDLPLLGTLVVYDSRTNDWTVTGTGDMIYRDQIERSVVWRGSLWLVRRSIRDREDIMYRLFSCKLDEGVWQRVPVTIPEECGKACSDLAVYKDRLLLVGIVDDDPELLLPDAGRGKIWELKEESGQWRAVPLAVAPSYFMEHWVPEACFVGQDGLLYIQLSQHSQRIAVCDLSTKPASWWLLPPCPLSDSRTDSELSYFTMPVTPRLDAFI